MVRQRYTPIRAEVIYEPGDYTIKVPSRYLNTMILVFAVWDHDNNWMYDEENRHVPHFTVGDCWGTYGDTGVPNLQLELINENIDIDLDSKATATISGEVHCEAHTSGNIYIYAYDNESMTPEKDVSATNMMEPPSETGASYKIQPCLVKVSFRGRVQKPQVAGEIHLIEGAPICIPGYRIECLN